VASKQAFPVSSYRVALLIVGVSVLMRLNLLSRRQAPLLDRLIALRRETALMLVGAAEAAEAIDFLMSGHTVKAYVRMELRRRLEELRAFRDKYGKALAAAEDFRAALAKMEPVSEFQRDVARGRVALHWKVVRVGHAMVSQGQKFIDVTLAGALGDAGRSEEEQEFRAAITCLRDGLPLYENLLEECRTRLLVTPIKESVA
jgi:hypothetical protein